MNPIPDPTEAQANAPTAAEVLRLLADCHTMLGNMAKENQGIGAYFQRWPIHHEPLRGDAKRLLPRIERLMAALAAEVTL